MPAPRYRSRSKRRKNVKTPGKVTKIHYQKPSTSQKKCAGCGRPINSIARLRGPNILKISRTKRCPNRMYGGFYCLTCLGKKIKTSVRKSVEQTGE